MGQFEGRIAVVTGAAAGLGAAIVNVASNVGRRGLPFRADYVCSKWVVIGLTQTLALELVDDGVRVNAVCPGPITGDRIEQVMGMHTDAEGKNLERVRAEWEAVPMGRFVEPSEVAGMIAFLAGDDASFMTGQSLTATDGFIMT